jgi:hypothetical protein
MQTPDKKKPEEGRPSAAPDVDRENQNVANAFEEASKDIEKDPDLSIHSPNDDLDEGESARLGGDKTDLV